MNTRRIAAIGLRQFFLMRGSVTRTVPLFVWVAIDMVLWGFITKYLNTVASPGFNFVPALLGAVLLWDFFTRVMQGVTMAFFEDVWSRNFLNIFGSPMSIAEYVTGLVLCAIATSSVGLVAMLLLAGAVFRLNLSLYGAGALPFIFVLFLFGIALGIMASSLVLRLGPSAEWFIWPIPALISPFAGVFYPLDVLPQWMQVLARGLPPAYVFQNLRKLVQGGEVSPAQLATGGILAIGYVLLASVVFTQTYRKSVRTGLIARYSAESVS